MLQLQKTLQEVWTEMPAAKVRDRHRMITGEYDEMACNKRIATKDIKPHL